MSHAFKLSSAALAIALIAGCSSQKATSSSDIGRSPAAAHEKTENTKQTTDAKKPSDVKKQEEERTEARSTGPQGPQVLLGRPATKGLLLTAQPPADTSKGLLVAIDTPYQIFSEQGSYVHVAAWTTSGDPAKQADVFIGDRHVGTTDDFGSIVFQHPPKGTKSTQGGTVTVIHDKDARGSVPFQPNVRTASFASDHLFAYTDRGVYKPGDEVNIRLIGWHLKDDYKPLVEQQIEVMLRDESGKSIGGAKRTTDEFGVTSLDIAIPRTASEGLYTLEVSYKQARQTARLQVRDMKPPRVVISHDLGRFLTADQDALAARITLAPTTGADFARGTLTMRATIAGTPRLELSKKITGNGPHTFELTDTQLAELKSFLSPGTWLNLELEVQDATGSKDRVVRELRYTNNPYVAVLELDKDQYSTDDDVEIVAKLRDLDGVPLRHTEIELRGLKSPLKATTDDSGTAQFSLVMPARNTPITLHVDGVSSPVATQTLRWTPPRAMVSHIPQPIIKERGTAHVTVKFPSDIIPAEEVVHMDVVDTSGAIVNAVLLPIRETDEGFVAEGDFSSPSWGSMLLTFFAIGEKKGTRRDPSTPQIGLMTEGQNLVVNPDRELTITLDGIPDKVAPSTDLNITARVTDHQGIITTASVGAAVVDQRILSLKDPLEITPMDHFYDPTLRTMSTTGSKILSWPVVSRNWGSRQRDVALPPFPFLDGGTPNKTYSSTKGGNYAPEPPTEDGAPMPKAMSKKPKKMSKKSSASLSQPLMDSSAMGDAEESVVDDVGSLRRESGTSSTPAGRPAQITIRTRFEETSTWRPHMRTNGELNLPISLPDTIAKQELILVASDDKGAVGIARKTIHVSQDLFAHADLPAVLYVGEQIDVPIVLTNTTNAPQDVTLSMQGLSAQLTNASVTLPANNATVVMARVTATSPGDVPFKLTVQSPTGQQDALMGTVQARAKGTSSTYTTRTAITPKRSVSHTLSIPDDGSASEAWISLTPPILTTAMSSIIATQGIVSERPLLAASDLATASLILAYAQKQNLSSPQLDDLRARVLSAMSALQIAQASDGSFSYWRQGSPSPYVTAWALEGMLEALQLDLPVPQDTIERASAYLVAQSGELVSTDEIAFWEGDTETVRRGVSAEIFDVLSRVPASMRSEAHRAYLERASNTFTAYLKGGSLDPLTSGRAVQALMRLEKISSKQARVFVNTLKSSRDEQYWEPSWFHAYGGRVEATAALIGAMIAADEQGYASDIRDALNWVLSTQNEWGQWHNERGTAAALRALIAAPRAEDVRSGELVIKLDGKEIKRVKLSAEDPFMSAPELQHITLGNALSPGTHKITATFDGTMHIPVHIFHRVWRGAASTSASTSEGHELKVSAAKTLNATQESAMTLNLAMASGHHTPATLTIARSALVDLDLAGLDALVEEKPELMGWRVDAHEVIIELAPTLTSTTLKLPVKAARTGEGQWPSIAVKDVGAAQGMLVSAGDLKIK